MAREPLSRSTEPLTTQHLTDLGAELSLTGGSHATVYGQFTNATGSFVDLDAFCSCGSSMGLPGGCCHWRAAAR